MAVRVEKRTNLLKSNFLILFTSDEFESGESWQMCEVISSSLSRDKVQAGKGEILKDKQKENGP